jgi:DNA-binding LacI/PurR family transcriptional regulator
MARHFERPPEQARTSGIRYRPGYHGLMSSAPDRPATIRDVARLSGVSIATVTRTYQNSPRVRPETSARVLQVAHQLRYRPDANARALVTGKSSAIGLLIPSLLEDYWGEIADSIERSAAGRGLSLVLASSRGEPEREAAMIDLLLGKRLDGIIVAGGAGDPAELPGRTGPQPPVVVLDWDSPAQAHQLELAGAAPLTARLFQMTETALAGSWKAHLSLDDVAGGRLIGRHLLDLGHRSIAFVAGTPTRRSSLLRLLGLRSSLDEAGQQLQCVLAAEDTFHGGRIVGGQLLAGQNRPTAIVCYSDMLAIGLIDAAHKLGLDVPGELSVTGYDDIEVSGYLDPPLTTIRNPKRELGELAVHCLLEESGSEPTERKLTGSLVVRDSTGAPAC